MVSGQRTFIMLGRQLFISTCKFLMVVVVVLEVSPLYSRTILTSVLKIVTLVSVKRCFDFHMFFDCRNAVLALPILAFKSASDAPRLSMILPRCVKLSTSSTVSLSDAIGLLFSVLYFRILFSRCLC
ncbi:unnamed protein product [Schistosoma margrebowiei]|uniref:Uncharacterized protein n=1 Tax=Schistosoma margrebowiei TaxID=48269 RepID=A0A183LRG1_9TREM|nr:unnamed protein product [Schistosoma margrebowiei]